MLTSSHSPSDLRSPCELQVSIGGGDGVGARGERGPRALDPHSQVKSLCSSEPVLAAPEIQSEAAINTSRPPVKDSLGARPPRRRPSPHSPASPYRGQRSHPESRAFHNHLSSPLPLSSKKSASQLPYCFHINRRDGLFSSLSLLVPPKILTRSGGRARRPNFLPVITPRLVHI